jgi:hypothetical protein
MLNVTQALELGFFGTTLGNVKLTSDLKFAMSGVPIVQVH